MTTAEQREGILLPEAFSNGIQLNSEPKTLEPRFVTDLLHLNCDQVDPTWLDGMSRKLFRFQYGTGNHYGVGLHLVDRNDPERVWTIIEQKKKKESTRDVDQWSVPMESIKAGEYPFQTILGVMAEVLGEEDKEFGSNIYLTPRSYIPDVFSIPVGVDKKSMACDYVIAVYDGPLLSRLPTPLASEEVSPVGFMRVSDLMSKNIRPTASLFLSLTSRLVKDAIRSYHQGEKIPLFSPSFSLQSFYQDRELSPDRTF